MADQFSFRPIPSMLPPSGSRTRSELAFDPFLLGFLHHSYFQAGELSFTVISE